jgi:hypothetical protein
MHLGAWGDLSMVLKYTRSMTFEDRVEHYTKIPNCRRVLAILADWVKQNRPTTHGLSSPIHMFLGSDYHHHFKVVKLIS